MSSERAVRKLAAILAADVVGYSRLIELDEANTLAAMKELRISVFDRLLLEHRGRIVKLMGDGTLVEFSSAVDAVACAVAIQGEVAERQAGTDPKRRIIFRMGINLGDVAVDGDDLMGDGVNVAARLEQLSSPGGIVISGTTYDQLQGRFDLPLDFMGAQKVKNISRPVRVYRVRLSGKKPVLARWPSMGRRAVWALGVVSLAFLAIGALWSLSRSTKPLENPSVAVLPFENYGPDGDARLVEGLTEDIVSDLARNGGFEVMSMGATQGYKKKPVDLAVVHRDLNVRYLLNGSVQRQGEHVKISAQILDAVTGANLWSERYDRPSTELFDVQGEIADKVANWLYWTVGSKEKAAAKRKRPTDLNAWELYLLAADSIGAATDKNIGEVKSLLLRATTLDPNLSRAHALLADTYSIMSQYAQDPSENLAKAEAAAKQAIESDPLESTAHAALANVLCSQGSFEACKLEFDRALQISPSSFELLVSYSGWASAFGAAKEGAAAADRAIRMFPTYPIFAARNFPYAFMLVGRYDDAVKSALHIPADKRRPLDVIVYASSLALSGHPEEAKTVVASAVPAFPAILNIEAQISGGGWAPHELPVILDGMSKAGFPMCSPDKDSSGAPIPLPAKRLPECVGNKAHD
jgi:class 3 adenylate cyclase/TolB-like protein